jgi:hypothetical protein
MRVGVRVMPGRVQTIQEPHLYPPDLGFNRKIRQIGHFPDAFGTNRGSPPQTGRNRPAGR